MKLYLAPIQGHTDDAYRHFHARQFADTDIVYTTPFIRLEKGGIRKKDIREALSPLNEGIAVVPQVIFKNYEELSALISLLKAEGIGHIDINMGCPFPLQTSRGRGAATIASEECINAVERVINENDDVRFSVKIRLGMKDDEWMPLISRLNNLQLEYITVHPRTAKDQYQPDTLKMESFDKIYAMSSNPLVYNGDIRTPEDAKMIMEKYPDLYGIMIGRGALARPSLLTEISAGEEWDHAKRLEAMKRLHRSLISYYQENLIGGEHQILSKILPFWEYAEDEIGRKAWKAIKKASTMAKYQTALTLIE